MSDPTMDEAYQADVQASLYGEGGGGKGGGDSQRTPQEAPNTLRSTSKARLIDAIGEGEVVGLVNGLQSVYLDDTPLQDESGEFNFQGVTVHTRNGEPNQAHIPGFPAVETANDVSTEVTQEAPVVRTVGNLDADAVRVTVQLPALNEQNTTNGDLVGASATVAIDVRPNGGAWVERKRDTIAGKTTSPYQRTYRIDLDGTGPWDVRLRRITADSDAVTLNNATYWATFTEVIDAKLSYPDTALVALEVDAQQFGNQIPARSYDVKGLILRVPDNYDPETRAYTGFWSGNFKLAWSDNPAWCYYDLATKTRYGAALANVDKWALYQIAQYCDELVPDGFGGEEPRFTFNTVLASQEEAITALHTLASAFRGMTYWGTNTVMPVADMPADPVKLVTPANVKDGEFVYEGTGLKARHSVALVSYNDPNDNYRQQVEVVEDVVSIEQYGWRPLEINAVACTSRGQAHRLGKWTLASERAETETVSYRASVDHADVRPGDIISVSDPTTAGARLGGRIVATGTATLTLDKVPEEASGANWFLDVMLPNGGVERRAVAGFSGDVVALANPLSSAPIMGAVWILSSQAVEPRRFRVLANIEESARVYHITALEHDPTKYGRIELGLDLPEPDYSLLPSGPVVAPYSITAQAFTYLAGGTEHQGLTISWTPSDDPRVLRYIVEVQGPSDLRWRTVYTETGTSVDLRDVEPGQWMIRVRGVTGIGTASPWVALTTNIGGLLLPLPPDSVDVEVGTFTITLRPRGAYPGQMYEFWRSNVALQLNQITSNAIRLSVSTDLTDTELTPGTTYYYYIRGTNAYGVSSWYPIQATTELNPEKILQVLTDEIRETHLYQTLAERIDKIDGPETLDGSVTQRIAEQAAQRGVELEEVRGELIEGFQAEAQARAQAIQEETENRTVAMTELSETVENEFGLLGLQINAIAAAYDATAASIYTMTQIRIDDQEVVATQISQLAGRVDENDALILNEQQIRINQYSSLATQVGILSARLDVRPSLNSGFEPGADFDAWSATSGNAISAVTSGVYSGLQSALVTSTAASASPSTGGVRRIIAPETATEFAGHEIRLSVYAKQPESGAAAEFALSYQVAGESAQWYRFTPGSEWAFFDVVIGVPAETGSAEHAVSIWGDTAGGGNGVQLDRLMVTFAEIAIPEVTAAIEQIQQALVDQDQALAQELIGFSAQLDTNTAAIQQEITARTTLTDSLANSVQTLQAATQDNAAAIVAEREAWSTETDALAEQLDQLIADVGDGGVASIEEERRVRASEDEYLASLQRVLSAAEGVNSASYQFQTTTRITAEEAEAVRNEQLQAQIGESLAAIESEATVRASETEALTQQINTQASVAANNTALIQTESTTRASAVGALAEQINTVQVEFNDELASVQQSTQVQYNQTTQRLEAMWTLRIDNGGRVSGIGLADDGEMSSFAIRADRFYIAHPNDPYSVLPMIIDGGQVLINDALINKLLFTKLRSSDGSLVFENGKLRAEYIQANQIEVVWGQITGTKPAQDADKTGANTAYDTARVGGTSAGTVRNQAANGDAANNRVTNWTRPNSTLINGNQISAADAFLDTVQIKGQAVTIPSSGQAGGEVLIPDGWVDIVSVGFVTTGAPISITANAILAFAGSYSAGVPDDGTAQMRLLINRNETWAATVMTHPGGFTAFAAPAYTVMRTAPAGAVSIVLQVRRSGGIAQLNAYGRNITAIEVKR